MMIVRSFFSACVALGETNGSSSLNATVSSLADNQPRFTEPLAFLTFPRHCSARGPPHLQS